MDPEVPVLNSKSLFILNIFFKLLVIESSVKVYNKIRVDKCVIGCEDSYCILIE